MGYIQFILFKTILMDSELKGAKLKFFNSVMFTQTLKCSNWLYRFDLSWPSGQQLYSRLSNWLMWNQFELAQWSIPLLSHGTHYRLVQWSISRVGLSLRVCPLITHFSSQPMRVGERDGIAAQTHCYTQTFIVIHAFLHSLLISRLSPCVWVREIA